MQSMSGAGKLHRQGMVSITRMLCNKAQLATFAFPRASTLLWERASQLIRWPCTTSCAKERSPVR